MHYRTVLCLLVLITLANGAPVVAKRVLGKRLAQPLDDNIKFELSVVFEDRSLPQKRSSAQPIPWVMFHQQGIDVPLILLCNSPARGKRER